MRVQFIQKIIDIIRGKRNKKTEAANETIFPIFRKELYKNNAPDICINKVNKLKNNLNETSQKAIDISIDKIIESLTQNNSLKRFLTEEQRRQEILFKQELSAIKNKYLLPLEHYTPEVFYFHHGLRFMSEKQLNYIANKDFIDCGAYIGDSFLILNNYRANKIYSFEFSKQNITYFNQTAKMNKIDSEKYELVQKGVSRKNDNITISDIGGPGVTIFECPEPKKDCHSQNIELISIDSFVEEKKINVGFIKADVEGFLLDVVKGAAKTLKTQKPLLSFGIYHSPEEFFEVKPYIEELVPEYEFEIIMMNFSPHFLSELTLLAYPRVLK